MMTTAGNTAHSKVTTQIVEFLTKFYTMIVVADQYRCVCNQECNNYVGSATTLASKWTVVTVTSLVLLLSNKFMM